MSVATVRTLTADPELHSTRSWVGDGVTKTFDLENVPVVTGSVTVTLDGVATTDFTQADVYAPIVFTVAPGSGVKIVARWKHVLLTDENLQELLDLNDDNVLLAAAHALDIIASNQALVLKKIKTLDLQTDGEAVARALREHAKRLREEAQQESAFGYAEMNVTDFTAREILLNRALRGEL